MLSLTRPVHARLAALALALALALGGALMALPAGAATQEVTGVVGSSVAISTPPTASVAFGALASGLNTASGGTLGVSANTAYTVTVVADKAAMTAWDGSAYGATALSTPLALVPTLAAGAPVVSPVAAVSTTPQTVLTGTGLVSDSATLELQQTVLPTDAPGTYRTVLTYTAAPAL